MGEAKLTPEQRKKADDEFAELQKEATVKQQRRNETMGELLRSKGFFWLATSRDIIGGWQQAGNVIRIEAQSPWLCKIKDVWEGTASEWQYKDRRQEIVFIGHGMKVEVIRQLLDDCLLTEEEMEMGPLMWKMTMKKYDKYNFVLEDDLDSSESEDSEGSEDEDEYDEKVERMGMNNSEQTKGKKRMMGSQGGRHSKI